MPAPRREAAAVDLSDALDLPARDPLASPPIAWAPITARLAEQGVGLCEEACGGPCRGVFGGAPCPDACLEAVQTALAQSEASCSSAVHALLGCASGRACVDCAPERAQWLERCPVLAAVRAVCGLPTTSTTSAGCGLALAACSDGSSYRVTCRSEGEAGSALACSCLVDGFVRGSFESERCPTTLEEVASGCQWPLASTPR